MVYKVTCNGCSSIYVGQISRHVTTRISEHQKKDTPVWHLVECCGTAHNIEWEILDTSQGWKTKDNRSDLYEKAGTAIEYARWVREAGIDIEVLAQMQIWVLKFKNYSSRC